jgi:hypothetical protein
MSSRSSFLLFALFVALASGSFLRAQNAETKEPKMQAANPTPDLSGVWNRRGVPNERFFGYGFSAEELPMTPWGLEKFKANKPSFGPHAVIDTNDPTYDCNLPGIPRIYVHPTAFEIIETPGRVIQYFEYDGFVRQIWTDGRPHMKIEDPHERLWMGDSIGHWEGDTLVIDTTNFNDKTWLDRAGHPHSEDLHEMERIRRADPKTLSIDLTIEDPKAYTRPITAHMIYQLRSDWRIFEHACTDYPRPLEP